MKVCKNEKDIVLKAILQGEVDAASASYSNLIDDIILTMNQHGLLSQLDKAFIDNRDDNASIPQHLLLSLAVAAKMKLKTSLTDIPYAINDASTLADLGYNIIDTERGLEEGLFTEGSIRNWIKRYTDEEPSQNDNVYSHPFIDAYNTYVQDRVFPSQNMIPHMHILDCSKIEVLLENKNYEHSEVVKDQDGTHRGYKIGVLRGIVGDTGVLEEIKMGSIKQHDMELCRDMLLKSPLLKSGDILINDRGFLSRDVMNTLKTERGVDTYIPVKKNMDIYKTAVSIAMKQKKWQQHPNKKRKTQQIAFVSDLGPYWESDDPKNDVPLNACVVHDTQAGKYFVFVTTDLSTSAKQIVQTYELRPEIEEDFRQLKDFWKLEDFKSTKYAFVIFHIVMVLIGYLYFQVFKVLDGNEKFQRKSLPVLLKNYVPKKQQTSIIIYAGAYFGIFGLMEILKLYASCSEEVKQKLEPALSLA
ncbi:Transposase [Mycobacterium tuberculosis]|jgi:hypothetical protein|nr:Transposase [Mycobacterium tuberculosis]